MHVVTLVLIIAMTVTLLRPCNGPPAACRYARGADLGRLDPQLRDRKIDQLASVIAAMNTGHGPDLLGVREVENRSTESLRK